MSSSIKATYVHFDPDSMWVELSDGRTLGVPLTWFPRLLRSTAEQREQVRISARGLHWEALDEDISIADLLAGQGDQTRHRSRAARFQTNARLVYGGLVRPCRPARPSLGIAVVACSCKRRNCATMQQTYVSRLSMRNFYASKMVPATIARSPINQAPITGIYSLFRRSAM